MKNIIIGLTGSFLPVYSFITWIITFNQPNLTNQSERVNAYFNTYFFNVVSNALFLALLNLLLIAISVYFISKATSKRGYVSLKNLYLLGLGLIAMLNIWSLL